MQGFLLSWCHVKCESKLSVRTVEECTKECTKTQSQPQTEKSENEERCLDVMDEINFIKFMRLPWVKSFFGMLAPAKQVFGFFFGCLFFFRTS